MILKKLNKLFKRAIKHPTYIGVSKLNLFTFPAMLGKEGAGVETASNAGLEKIRTPEKVKIGI